MGTLRNSGMQRWVLLMVTKKIAGTVVAGYPRTYRVGDAFENYTAISNEEMSSMPVTDFKSRLSAFKKYVEGIEIGIEVDITNAYRENIESCPI